MKRNAKQVLISIVAAVLLVLSIFIYQKWAIAKEIDPKFAVYTKVDIPPRTLITEEMVEVYEVPSRTIPPNAARSLDEVVGKWTTEGYGLSENSLVYTGNIVTKDQLPDAGILNLQENEESFPLLVDIETSLGNSIMPETYMDLYFRTVVRETIDGRTVDKPVFGKVASRVRVTAAKDAEAINVFSESGKEESAKSGKEKRPLTKLYIFGVTKEQNEILNKGKMIGEIIPIANGKSYKKDVDEEEFGTEEEMIEWINEQSYLLNSKEELADADSEENN